MLALSQIYKAIKPVGWLYVEVPSPNTISQHEANFNHFSILGRRAWGHLLTRSGFIVMKEIDFEFDTIAGPDTYFSFLCLKTNYQGKKPTQLDKKVLD